MTKEFTDVRAGEVVRILKSMGFRPFGKGKRVRLYEHENGRCTTVPVDPDRILLPKLVEYILRDVRIKDDDFQRLRNAS